MNRERLFLLFSLIAAVVAGVISAAGVGMIFRHFSGAASGLTASTQLNEMELMLKEIETKLEQRKEEHAAMEARLSFLEQAVGRQKSRLEVPVAYVRQVEDFFQGDQAKNLLSPTAKEKGPWRFSSPTFIEPQLISVVYTNGAQTEVMMCRIEMIDYYDLQFRVIWDSWEGKR